LLFALFDHNHAAHLAMHHFAPVRHSEGFGNLGWDVTRSLVPQRCKYLQETY
jgi:hypothetical protein